MRTLMVLTLVMAVFAGPVAAATCEIAEDGMAVVEGKRTFILGMYAYPDEDARLRGLAEAGFNLVRSPRDKGAMDRLAELGMWAWITTGSAIDLSESSEDRRRALEEMAETWADHPALLVWEVPDEALWNCWYRAIQWRSYQEPEQLQQRVAALTDKALATGLQEKLDRVNALREVARFAEAEALADSIWEALGEPSPNAGFGLSNAPERAAKMCQGMVDGYRHLKAIDPAHPIWMNHAPRNQIDQLAAFNKAADIVGCDIYPVPVSNHVHHSDLAMQRMPSVGDYTDRMQAAAPGKPVWMVLQGFGWGALQKDGDPEVVEELRSPTLAETRFMAWDAVVHGARGVLYWGTHAMPEDAAIHEHLLALARELNALQPVISAPDAAVPVAVHHGPHWGSLERGVRVLAKDVAGQTWLIAVNEWNEPMRYTIMGLDGLDGTRYTENTDENVNGVVKDGTLTLHIAAESVHVLRPSQ